jgi:transcriptional regulator with XRE-family HTH domain
MPLINQDQIHTIIELSKTLTQSEIAFQYGVSYPTVSKILRANGVATNKGRLNLSRLNFNFNYFDSIDTPEKAYWLGYLAADGCLKNNKVKLISKDLDHIEKFKLALESEHAITTTNIYDKRTDKYYRSHHIQITSQAFCNKLQEYIPVNKSNNFTIPDISFELYPDFLAGMIDGDGSFSVSGQSTLVVNLISTKECLLQIQEYLLTTLTIKKTALQPVTKNKQNVWKLYIYAGAYDFLKLIYRQPNKKMYLTRKQIKFDAILKSDMVFTGRKMPGVGKPIPKTSHKGRPVIDVVYNVEYRSVRHASECIGMSESKLWKMLNNVTANTTNLIYKSNE